MNRNFKLGLAVILIITGLAVIMMWLYPGNTGGPAFKLIISVLFATGGSQMILGALSKGDKP